MATTNSDEGSEDTAPQVRVIIVNYNAGPLLKRCLNALSNQTFRDFEAVVVDNGSTDASFEGAVPKDARFRVIEAGENLGFAAGNNRGAAGCKTPWIATLNPDAFAEPDWLEKILEATRRHPNVAMFGSTQFDAEDAGRLDGSGDAFFATGLAWRGNYGRPIRHLPPEGKVFGPCAAAALYQTNAFNAVGGFDERYFCYYEDVDLAFAMRLMGGRCIQVRDAVVRHIGSGLTGSKSDFVRYHSARNRLWLFVKNMPPWLFWPLLPAHGAMQFSFLLWALGRGHFVPTWRGMRDGLRALPAVWRDRQRIQGARRASTGGIARALTWSPIKLLRRAHDVRRIG